MRPLLEGWFGRMKEVLKLGVTCPSASNRNPKVDSGHTLPVPLVVVIEVDIENIRRLLHPALGTCSAHFGRLVVRGRVQEWCILKKGIFGLRGTPVTDKAVRTLVMHRQG